MKTDNERVFLRRGTPCWISPVAAGKRRFRGQFLSVIYANFFIFQPMPWMSVRKWRGDTSSAVHRATGALLRDRIPRVASAAAHCPVTDVRTTDE